MDHFDVCGDENLFEYATVFCLRGRDIFINTFNFNSVARFDYVDEVLHDYNFYTSWHKPCWSSFWHFLKNQSLNISELAISEFSWNWISLLIFNWETFGQGYILSFCKVKFIKIFSDLALFCFFAIVIRFHKFWS